MRNVTISLDDDLARKARVAAAKRDMSLSKFVAELLRKEVDAASEDYEEARKAFFRRPLRPLRDPTQPLPSRDEHYDRPSLRR